MRFSYTPVFLLMLLYPSLAFGEDKNDLVSREGIYYENFSDLPFTGRVVGQWEGSFKEGRKNGPWVTYYENKKVLARGAYNNGKREGLWVTFYKNGQLYFKASYKNDEADGPYFVYYSNGQLMEKGFFVKGKMEGLSHSYSINGWLFKKGNYKNDMRVGPWMLYKGTVHYENGQLVPKRPKQR